MSMLAEDLAAWVREGAVCFAFELSRDGEGKKTLDVIGGRRFVVTVKGAVVYEGPSSAHAAQAFEHETSIQQLVSTEGED